MSSIDEDLKVLDVKLNQLKLDYERYFLGTRPREPVLLRSEVQKMIVLYTNTSIQKRLIGFHWVSSHSLKRTVKWRMLRCTCS